MTNPPVVAALGSSFAAGPGLEPVEDAAAMRSSRNYPHLLAEALGARLVDLTVSGATTGTILDEAQLTMSGEMFAPQIEGVPADADLITVTAGGNDLSFLGSMVFCAQERSDPNGEVTEFLRQQFVDGIPEPTSEAIEATADGLVRIVSEARSRAVGARVLLVDYLTVLPDSDDATLATIFTPDQTGLFRRIQAGLVEAYRLASDRAGAELVPISASSRGHALGTEDPWVLGFEPGLDAMPRWFHPNHAGMRAVAREILRVLRAGA